jgi:hypothetical protein
MNIPRSERHARGCALLAGCSVAVFVLVCGAAQFLRGDLDWIAAPLSYYLTGPLGTAVIAAYLALSAGLIALGLGFRFALAAQARSFVPVLLFEWEIVHRLAAMTTFLSVTVAMLLQSFWLRFDPRWRGSFVFAFVLAAAAFAALWIYSLVHSLPRGLAQKAVIALILAWLGWAVFALRSRTSR